MGVCCLCTFVMGCCGLLCWCDAFVWFELIRFVLCGCVVLCCVALVCVGCVLFGLRCCLVLGVLFGCGCVCGVVCVVCCWCV